MSLNQDLAREIEEYWDRAEARLESMRATLRTTSNLLSFDGVYALDETQKSDLIVATKQMIDQGIAAIEAHMTQYGDYMAEPVELRSPLPDERDTA